jgi:hypothetical protein
MGVLVSEKSLISAHPNACEWLKQAPLQGIWVFQQALSRNKLQFTQFSQFTFVALP